MINTSLDPVNVPHVWHRFLYRSVLLEWETSLHECKWFPRFNARRPIAGINLFKQVGPTELRQWLASQAPTQKPSEFFVFYSKGSALKELFVLIRNCVAHGHYSSPRKGWLQLHHCYRGNLKLSGQVKFSNFEKLITSIVTECKKLEAGHV